VVELPLFLGILEIASDFVRVSHDDFVLEILLLLHPQKRGPWLNAESPTTGLEQLIYFCLSPIQPFCVVAKSATTVSGISQMRGFAEW